MLLVCKHTLATTVTINPQANKFETSTQLHENIELQDGYLFQWTNAMMNDKSTHEHE